jgi:hypothetical protein
MADSKSAPRKISAKVNVHLRAASVRRLKMSAMPLAIIVDVAIQSWLCSFRDQ